MRILGWVATGALVVTVLVALAYYQNMNRAYERVCDKGTVISSAFRDLEFTEGGSGPDVLVIHGSGGGYDQGELISAAVLRERVSLDYAVTIRLSEIELSRGSNVGRAGPRLCSLA